MGMGRIALFSQSDTTLPFRSQREADSPGGVTGS
jgi:hypothetical protein